MAAQMHRLAAFAAISHLLGPTPLPFAHDVRAKPAYAPPTKKNSKPRNMRRKKR